MQIVVGGADIGATTVPLGAGDYLLANLVFSLSSPTEICVDSTHDIRGFGIYMVTELAMDYYTQWGGSLCCGPIVPALSEWGLIAFGVLLLGSLVFYLSRSRSRLA